MRVVVAALFSLVVACGGVLGADFSGLTAAPADAGVDAPSSIEEGGNAVINEGGGLDAFDASDAQDILDASDASDARDVLDASDASDAQDVLDASPLPPGSTVIFPAAIDVAVGVTDDVIWLLEKTRQPDDNHLAYQWNAGSSTFEPSAYSGVAIDVTPSGPCLIKYATGAIWASQSNGSLAQLVGGIGGGIGAGSSGDVWVVSTAPQPTSTSDFEMYRWDGSLAGNPFYQEGSIYGLQVDLASDGSAWLALAAGNAMHAVLLDNGGFNPQIIPVDGTVTGVGVGAAGVFAVGKASDGTPSFFKYSTTDQRFEVQFSLDATKVSVGSSKVVVVMSDGRVASFTP